MSACPDELKRLYREQRVIPFVGAGASMSVKWTRDGKEMRGPSWAELVDEAARVLGFSDARLIRARGTDLQILEYFKTKRGSLQELANWLYAAMQPDDASLTNSAIHQALAALIDCPIYYTTNYDNFLERSLTLLGRNVATIAAERDILADPRKTQVVKFHGDFNHPDEMVLSESHYERRLKLESELDLKLHSDVLGRAILFVGYSFRDWNVAYLFRLINDTFGPLPNSYTGKRAYIIVFDPSEFELQLFNARNIQVIPASGADKVGTTAAVLEEMRR